MVMWQKVIAQGEWLLPWDGLGKNLWGVNIWTKTLVVVYFSSENNLLSNAKTFNSKTLRWDDRWCYQGKISRPGWLGPSEVIWGLHRWECGGWARGLSMGPEATNEDVKMQFCF